MKGTPTSPEMIGKIMALYENAMSTRAIEAELGVSRSTVSKVIAGNALKITSNASIARQMKKAISKTAKPVTTAKTVITSIPFSIPDDAPICNATAQGIYRGSELSYRQPSRA